MVCWCDGVVLQCRSYSVAPTVLLLQCRSYSVAPTVSLHTLFHTVSTQCRSIHCFTLFPHSVAPYTVSHSHHRGSIWTVLPPTHFYTLSIRGNRLDGFHMLSLKLLHPITHTARVIPVLLTCVLIVLSLTHKFSH